MRRATMMLKGALVYGALGPLVALAVLMAVMATLGSRDGDLAILGTLGMGLPFFAALTYAFGVLPAIVTGAVAGALAHGPNRWRAIGVVTLVGTLTSLVPGGLLATHTALVLCAVLGAVSAFACSLVFLRAPRHAPTMDAASP